MGENEEDVEGKVNFVGEAREKRAGEFRQAYIGIWREGGGGRKGEGR